MSEAARHQLATLIAMEIHCCVAMYDLTDDELEHVLANADVVVDAVLGYRIHDAPRDEAERLIGFITRAGRPVVSLDLPSGLDPDSGEAAGIAIAATATLTLALPKPGLFQGEGPDRAGRVYLGDIGLPEALYTGLGISVGHPFSAGLIVLLDRTA
jgi:NAD(P)H-hydrate epimerase